MKETFRRPPPGGNTWGDNRLEEALREALAAHGGAPLSTDPVGIVRRYRSREDLEAAAFIAASFAFGGVPQIRAFLERLFGALGPSPHGAVAGPRPVPPVRIAGMRHRFISPEGVRRFLGCMRKAYLANGSLEALYVRGSGGAGPVTRERLARFLEGFRGAWEAGLEQERSFLFPDPLKGSACKRHNLFLRWVVRGGDGIDLGIWKSVSPRDLLVPVDTHMARIARWMGVTNRGAADWKTAEEITAAFRRICPGDPVRFDFALTRIGIMKECTARRTGECAACPLRRICTERRGGI